MTTNQQIDKIIGALYQKQIKQSIDWAELPTYHELCKQLFADVPHLSEKHYQNLLYILISKRLINTYPDSATEAYHKPISLKSEVIVWYEQFHSYLDYLDYLEQKNQPKALQEDINADSEQIGQKLFWSKIPAWIKILVGIAVVAGIATVIAGFGK